MKYKPVALTSQNWLPKLCFRFCAQYVVFFVSDGFPRPRVTKQRCQRQKGYVVAILKVGYENGVLHLGVAICRQLGHQIPRQKANVQEGVTSILSQTNRHSSLFLVS